VQLAVKSTVPCPTELLRKRETEALARRTNDGTASKIGAVTLAVSHNVSTYCPTGVPQVFGAGASCHRVVAVERYRAPDVVVGLAFSLTIPTLQSSPENLWDTPVLPWIDRLLGVVWSCLGMSFKVDEMSCEPDALSDSSSSFSSSSIVQNGGSSRSVTD